VRFEQHGDRGCSCEASQGGRSAGRGGHGRGAHRVVLLAYASQPRHAHAVVVVRHDGAPEGVGRVSCCPVTHEHRADLDMASYSAAAAPASKEKRMRALSGLSPTAPRFPVLRFLGICKAGQSLSLPPAWAACVVSSPVHAVFVSNRRVPSRTAQAQGNLQHSAQGGTPHHGQGSRRIYRAYY
jgi:hypothetical protein